MTFTLRLEELRCHDRQEFDGDEIYLKMNGQEIFSWKAIGKSFMEAVSDHKHTNAFDFRTCSYATPDGWQSTEAYKPQQFVFADIGGGVNFELWESDAGNPLRGADDELGTLTLVPYAGIPRQQTFRWRTQGAYYELTCVVTEE